MLETVAITNYSFDYGIVNPTTCDHKVINSYVRLWEPDLSFYLD